jgi:hypothetical protein
LSNQFGIPHRRSVIAVLAVTAIALLSLASGGPGAPVARAASSVNLDQWATLDGAWQNGNLNGNNTRYPEGGIVPFRLAVEGLKTGAHTIRIQYDFTAGGHKAYDFLARYNGWVAPPICGAGGGGISSMCPSIPAASSAAFPSDGFTTDGLSVRGAQDYSGVSRRLTIWGGTITSISGPVHTGSTAGNSTAEFVVHFTSKGSAVELAWGGHLAQSAFWDVAVGGQRDGAGQVSGAPWHMRTLQLDGSGNRNQDRSIQPSAIVGELPPRALAPATPTPRPTPRPSPTPSPTPVLRRTVRPPATPVPTAGVPVVGGAPPRLPDPTAPPTSVEVARTMTEADDTAARTFLPILLVVWASALALALRRDRGGAQPH